MSVTEKCFETNETYMYLLYDTLREEIFRIMGQEGMMTMMILRIIKLFYRFQREIDFSVIKSHRVVIDCPRTPACAHKLEIT